MAVSGSRDTAGAALALQKGRFYRNVNVTTLTNEAATRGAMIEALKRLRLQATPRDVVAIMISGHGVLDDANQEMALRSVLFGAVGTSGQRCTSLRRLILQRPIAGAFTERLVKAYKSIKIGDPLDEKTTMGPLVTKDASPFLAPVHA